MLAQALDASHPLLERVKFLAIVATNLDEFFMIRVSTTLKKLKEGIDDVAPDGYDTAQQLFAMRERAHRMLDEQVDCWAQLRPLLAAEGIHFLETGDRTPAVREFLATQFSREIFKVNAVTDDQMIRVLYRASQAGASIDLICRGIPPWCSILRGSYSRPEPGSSSVNAQKLLLDHYTARE